MKIQKKRDFIAVCGFGYGGTNLLYHMISSNVDVATVDGEIHKAIKGGTLSDNFIRKLVRRIIYYIIWVPIFGTLEKPRTINYSWQRLLLILFTQIWVKLSPLNINTRGTISCGKFLNHHIRLIKLFSEIYNVKVLLITRDLHALHGSMIRRENYFTRPTEELENRIIDVATAIAENSDLCADIYKIKYEDMCNAPLEAIEDLEKYYGLQKTDTFVFMKKEILSQKTDAGKIVTGDRLKVHVKRPDLPNYIKPNINKNYQCLSYNYNDKLSEKLVSIYDQMRSE